jgi:hypothetical protein
VGRIKVKLLLAIVVVATLATTIPALAATRTTDCADQSGDCEERFKTAERIIGTTGADDIFADLIDDDRDIVDAKQGSDHINVRDGDRRDRVDCGKGRDVVRANRHDNIQNNCERVRYN